ncbi:unnamed protein product [Bursaphelenchus okinawaensis]|uniref:Uncharacterized protein n=1 Tax=Bursaphelenchus okinawaensis TaxID=465554 RepID=A0A811KJ84_9BILA|nr:unnamed protein product [Bursaphelenchus okinawaensis]CAG9104791.1 unnamed protein product [Bursaphelenchus okinawaensis]
MFLPQDVYSKSTVKQWFEKVALVPLMEHQDTSISWSSLFDVMGMVLKQQLMALDEPLQMKEVTLNHLEGIKRIIGEDEKILPMITYTQEKFHNHFEKMKTWEAALIRCTLLNYLQGPPVKTGDMVRVGIRLQNGRFLLQGKEIRIPIDATPPGSVKYFEKGQVAKITTLVMPEKYLCIRKEDIPPGKLVTSIGESVYHPAEQTKEKVVENFPHVATGDDEMKLLNKLMTPPDNIGDFVFNLFNDEEEEEAREEDSKSTKSSSKPTGKTTRYKTLAEAIGEMELKKPEPEFQSRGEKMLRMMDESEMRTRSRSGSRKRNVTRDLR